MATRKSRKSGGRKKSSAGRKKAGARRKAMKARPRKAAKKKAARRTSRPATPAARKIQNGVITHTEFASSDPEATRAWCASVLGWKFGEPFPTETGPYHMWQFPNGGGGGGITSISGPGGPGSVPYCEVTDIRTTFQKALDAGASEVAPPIQLPGGMGWIAIVSVPGGVTIGFWGEK